jgi:hypothetical protein
MVQLLNIPVVKPATAYPSRGLFTEVGRRISSICDVSSEVWAERGLNGIRGALGDLELSSNDFTTAACGFARSARPRSPGRTKLVSAEVGNIGACGSIAYQYSTKSGLAQK